VIAASIADGSLVAEHLAITRKVFHPYHEFIESLNALHVSFEIIILNSMKNFIRNSFVIMI